MSSTAHNRKDTLDAEIRKQFGSTGTMRFIRSLPCFEVEPRLPDRLVNLLTDLDNAESRQYNGRSAD